MSGYDYPGFGSPDGCGGRSPGPEGGPGMNHCPRLAGWKKFRADAAQKVPGILFFRITFAGESRAGHAHDAHAIFE